MFLGISFAGTNESVANNYVAEDNISSITISNLILGEMYATKDVLLKFNWKIPTGWSNDTYLHAEYNDGTLHAGNIKYATSAVSSIRIKKRFVGDFDWKTIYEQPVVTNEDFAVEFYDYYEPTGREVEYVYVVVTSNAETDSATNSVMSEFDTYFICGPHGESYPMILNMEQTLTYKRQSNVITPPGSKYPYVVNNGITQYYAGNINVSFIKPDNNCSFDIENAWKYRNEIDQFLANGELKIIKSFEGDIWMVNVINDIPRSNAGHYQLVNHQIEWVEAGSPYSIADLYDGGFINTDVDR